MAGGGIKVELTVDDRKVQAVLARLARRGRDLRQPLDHVGSYLEDSARQRFRSGRGPGGIPWLRSGRAIEQGGRTLVDTGRLRDSMTHKASDREVEVGTNVIYARIHQLGGVIRAKSAPYLMFRLSSGSFVRTKQVTIPARPFLGVDAEDGSEILAILRDWIDGAAAEARA